MSKQNIFDNIDVYSAEELVEYIQNGVVTVEELEDVNNTNGLYPPKVRKKVREMLESKEPQDWANALEINSAESYQNYLSSYPNGRYRAEAEARLGALSEAMEANDWAEAKRLNTTEAYQAYLDKYDRGQYRDEARNRRDAIIQEGEAMAERREEEARLAAERWERLNKRDRTELQNFIQRIGDPSNSYVVMAQQHLNELDRALNEIKTRWTAVDKNSRVELEEFIRYASAYDPYNSLLNDARKAIAQLGAVDFGVEALLEEINKISTDARVLDKQSKIYETIVMALNNPRAGVDREDLLTLIEDDNNLLGSYVVGKLLNDGILTPEDLQDANISRDFIRQMARNVRRKVFQKSQRPIATDTKNHTTEIYFWGVPSSGKTCALGLILSVAQNAAANVVKSIQVDPLCQGIEYLNLLPQCFNITDGVTVLPEGTPPDCSYEMSFELGDTKDRIHPITCVDFAGEMIRSIYLHYTRPDNMGNSEKEMLELFTQLLTGKDPNGKSIGSRMGNRKIHFFVVEYGAEERLYEGVPQRNLLDMALSYIDQVGVFKNNTDAIYLIVTKVDKTGLRGPALEQKLSEYVKSGYGTFYGHIENICKKYNINGGQVPVLPFSLGKVCLQDMCKLDTTYAENVLKIIIERTTCEKTGASGWLSRIFRN